MPNRVDAFLELVVRQGGSDLHLVSGNPPRMRLYGDIVPIKYRELTHEETTNLIYEIIPEDLKAVFELKHTLDLAYDISSLSRFRVNVYRHLGGIAAVFRVIPHEIKTFESLGLPQIVKNFCQQNRGLILVTGPTGSGKSTTLAAMVDHLNKQRNGHIITVEDPIEFLHQRKSCLISQREVGQHTESFSAALRSALREDPDVLLVGELRDFETIGLAVTAAETGILVMGTLHTGGAAATMERIINVFPGSEQPRIRAMLSTSLIGVISQQLVKRKDGKGRLASLEVLVNNPAAANLIREGKPSQLVTVMQSGSLHGMQTMDMALRRLLDAGQISGDEAYRKANEKADFEEYREEDDLFALT